MRVAMTALASLLLAGGAVAAEPATSHKHGDTAAAKGGTGGGTGKVSLQDFHFSTRADAVAACDDAPISEVNGKFSCSLTPQQARMANNKHPDLMK